MNRNKNGCVANNYGCICILWMHYVLPFINIPFCTLSQYHILCNCVRLTATLGFQIDGSTQVSFIGLCMLYSNFVEEKSIHK